MSQHQRDRLTSTMSTRDLIQSVVLGCKSIATILRGLRYDMKKSVGVRRTEVDLIISCCIYALSFILSQGAER